MAADHDQLFRHTYGQAEHAASLLREALPAPVAAAIDWTSLRLVPGTSIDERLEARHVDLLFAAQLAGRPVLVYLLLEHKSAPDRRTALQLLRYVLRTWDRHLEQDPAARWLPPIVPVVVHHGDRPWRAPRSLGELIRIAGVPPATAAALRLLQPELRLAIDDLASQPEEELLARRGTLLHRLTLLLLQEVRPASARDPVELVDRWRDLWRALWRDRDGRTGLLALFSYLAAQLDTAPERLTAAAVRIHEDARTMGKSIADRLREEGIQQGLRIGKAEGKAEGEREGRVALLMRQLRRRFGAAADACEARVRGATSAQLEAWAERVLVVERLDQLFD